MDNGPHGSGDARASAQLCLLLITGAIAALAGFGLAASGNDLGSALMMLAFVLLGVAVVGFGVCLGIRAADERRGSSAPSRPDQRG